MQYQGDGFRKLWAPVLASHLILQVQILDCAVLESGTGSGSLTHSLARAVAPSGHVHTFDFHQKRAEEAAAEFARHGLGQLVTVQHRNIEAHGFPEDLRGSADALFLDLPGPWNVRGPALPHQAVIGSM